MLETRPQPRPATPRQEDAPLAAAPTATTNVAGGRLVSLDALRGFDMFLIIGGGRVFKAFLERCSDPRLKALSAQFAHVPWEGFHLWDFIFPLFLFMIGVAIPFSFASRLARGESKGKLYTHILKRVLILIVLGMMVNGNLLSYDPARFQITYSVLQMLALGYLVASVLYLNLSLRWQVAATAGLLVGYWALQTFVPVPGHVVGVYRPGANFGDWFNDRVLGDLQGRWRFGWIVGIMTHSATALLGVFAGQLLRSGLGHWRKFGVLVLLGVCSMAAGLWWAQWFPMIKDRWTSTFALYAGGWSYLLLAAFYLVIDVWGYRKWAFPFVVIGANSIVAYMAAQLFDPALQRAAEVFLRGLKPYSPTWYPVILLAGTMSILWMLLYALYRTKTFVKI